MSHTNVSKEFTPMLFRMTVLALTVLGGWQLAAQEASQAIEPGRPFPTLTFPSLHDGSPTSVADFRGQKVLLVNFASW